MLIVPPFILSVPTFSTVVPFGTGLSEGENGRSLKNSTKLKLSARRAKFARVEFSGSNQTGVMNPANDTERGNCNLNAHPSGPKLLMVIPDVDPL
jgi:hypothetical protein